MRTPDFAARCGGHALLAWTLLLGGCASVSSDGGFDAVTTLTRARAGANLQLARPGAEGDSGALTRQLLERPLTPDSAVQLALLNNQGLQADFAGLGIAEADLVQAGRLRNPGLTFGRLRAGDNSEIDRGIVFDIAGLLTLPLRSGIEQRRFEQARLDTAAAAVQLASETRRAYFQAVAAQQGAHYAQQVLLAAEAGAELAQRMQRVGNLSALDQAREQAFHAEANAQLMRARQQVLDAREQLTRLLGLSGEQATTYTLPQRLPELPAAIADMADAEQQALSQRLDVQVAMLDSEATARALGLTKTTRFINVLDLGYANKSQTGEPRRNGYEIALELPLFDSGEARMKKAEALYLQSLRRTADIALRARSEVRQAHAAYRTHHALARHYRDEVLPLRKRISDEVLLRYNGMLVSVFELLTDAREQVESVHAAIQAQRDFWIAETALQAAIHGGGRPAPRAASAGAGQD